MSVIGKMAKYEHRRRFYYLVLFGIVIVLFYAMVETPGHHPYLIHFEEGSASKT